MLTTSGSRLDPDISPANAALQVARVAHARGVSPVEIGALLQQHITGRRASSGSTDGTATIRPISVVLHN